MKLSMIKICSIFPQFNEAPITADDFWRAAKKEKIIVRQMPLIVDGYYTMRRGRHFILINSGLSGVRWLHTALHEFHHYLFDVPGAEEGYTFYRNGKLVDRRECRADAFALMGILPWPELLKLTPHDIEVSPWMANIVRDRITVRTEFGQ